MICDTSGLIAALWGDQPESERCARILSTASLAVVPPLVLAELDRIVTTHASPVAAAAVSRHLAASGFELPSLTWSDVEAALDVCATYIDLSIGLTDASLVVLARRYGTDEILTLDKSRFRAMRGLDGRHFRLLPFDID